MKKFGFVLFISGCWLLVSGYCTHAQDETLTLLTYYPAPYGVYNALKVGTAEADVAGITAPLQVGGASPVDTSIYAEQNSGGEAAAGYAGYFINNVAASTGIYTVGQLYGIEAISNSVDGSGGHFENTSETGTTYGVWARNGPDNVGVDSGAGVYGESNYYGVWGKCVSDIGSGVYADGFAQGALALKAITKNDTSAPYAGYFEGGGTDGCLLVTSSGSATGLSSGRGGLVLKYGLVEESGRLDLQTYPTPFKITRSTGNLRFYWGEGQRMKLTSGGDLYILGTLTQNSYDFAEMMKFNENITELEPGDVVCINPDSSNILQKSNSPYSKNLAGVISEKPAVLGNQFYDPLEQDEEDSENKNPLIDIKNNALPVAILGIVKTKVSCENGEIKPGDLLTTSSTPGHAMKAADLKIGTIVGKALEPLKEGKGKILVLVCLM